MNPEELSTEKKIINAARKVFTEKGLQGARMQEIADKAGINKALVHYYFRSKDKLFDAVFQESLSEMLPKLASELNKEATPDEIFYSVISFYNNYFIKNPFMPQFFFHEIWQHPEKLANFIKSNNIDPQSITEKFSKYENQQIKTNYYSQHLITNIIGMCIIPHIARPLIQRILFANENDNYDEFLNERTDVLTKMLASFMKSDPTNPETK